MSGTAPSPLAPLAFRRGPIMPNRLALAPLTNLQSHDDGTISEQEIAWLTKRAAGGFGMVMTCAASTHPLGKGFPRQLGVHDDAHLPGLERLAGALRVAGALSCVQLQHSGGRAPAALIPGQPISAMDDRTRGVRAMSTGEVEQAIEDFVLAGKRAEQAGFDGVEIHGGHGYLLCQFLDARNVRSDRYGATADNRARMLLEVVADLRARTRPDFLIGARLSPERHGIDFGEALRLAAHLLGEGRVDWLDISCWDSFKEPEDPAYRGRALIDRFAELDRGDARLGIAGKLIDAATVRECLARGADFALIGRGAILHHDFPQQVTRDPDFASVPLPVSRSYLARQALGPAFIDYMATWPGFVTEERA